MSTKKKRGEAIALIIFAAVNLFAFLLSYIPTYVLESSVLAYISPFLSDIISYTLPLAAAAAAAAVFSRKGTKGAVIYALLLSLTRLAYSLPYEYIKYVYDGYVSTDALLLSLIMSVLHIAILFAEALLLLLLIIFLTSKFAMDGAIGASRTKEALTAVKAFDLSLPTTAALLIGAAPGFVYSLIIEIIDTVNFILRYSGAYRAGEVVYISARYIFILAVFFLSYFIASVTLKQLVIFDGSGD